jgi:hypothetical protein
LLVLDWLEHAGKLVLGGDFYMLQKGRLRPTYENWSLSKEETASVQAVAIGLKAAKNNLQNMKNPEDRVVFVVKRT